MQNPYILILDGKLQGYYNSIAAAMYHLSNIKDDKKPSVKIYRESDRGQELVHEE